MMKNRRQEDRRRSGRKGLGGHTTGGDRTIMVQQNLLHPLDGEKKENLFGLGIQGSLQCHHPYIKCMISIYEGKPKIKMKEKTLCILSYSFFYFCHVVAAARAVVLSYTWSQFVCIQ